MDVAKKYSKLPFKSSYWLGLPIVILIIISTLFVYNHLRRLEYASLEQHIDNAYLLTVSPISQTLTDYSLAFQRMAYRWEAQKSEAPQLWYQDAENYYADTKVFKLILQASNDLHVQLVVPSSRRNLIVSDLKQDPFIVSAINKATASKAPVLTSQNTQFDNERLISVVTPILNGNQVTGFFIGFIEIEKFFKLLFSQGLGRYYGLAIYHNHTPVFATGTPIVNPYIVTERKFQLSDLQWEIYIWPTQELLNKVITPLPLWLLLTGFVIALLLLATILANERNRRISDKLVYALLDVQRLTSRTRQILDTVNEGFISIDEASTIIDWNPYAEKIFGWKAKEVIGKKIYQTIIPEEFREWHLDGIANFIKSGDETILNKNLEIIARHKDGYLFPIELNIFPMRTESGYSFSAFIRDITERKKNEESLARYEAIVHASDDAILSSDLQGRILTWNRGAERMYGYSEYEVIGKPVSIIYPDSVKDQVQETLQYVKQGKHLHLVDTVRKKRSGQIIPVSVSISPILNSEGKTIGIASSTRDMTERKKVERMKNEFISIVSHELRTPLTSIRGSLGLLIHEQVSPKAKQLLDIANKNCDRLIRLINDILDIEKIEAGKMEFTFTPQDPQELIKEAIEANQGLAHKYNVQLQYEIKSKAFISADRDRIIQVITNLLSNAIRYSPKQGHVHVLLEKIANTVRISIKDQGPGIAQEFQDKIFGKFSQADSSDTRQKSGTGLGLNISKSIIEKHFGILDFYSEPGKGSCFYFELPVLQETEQFKPRIDRQKTLDRVLICDRNLENAKYLQGLFEKKHLVSDIALDAKEAFKLLEKNNYLLIVVDVMLPNQDGMSFIKELRSNSQTQFIPVIISALQHDAVAGLKGNAFPLIDWLGKPADVSHAKKILDYITQHFNSYIPNILSIDDDLDVSKLLTLMLQDKANVWHATSIAEAREVLLDNEFDLVILDLNLPDGYGTELLPCMNAVTKKPIPVIVFSVDALAQQYAHLVKSSFIKTKVTNEQLFSAIESAINIGNQE